MCCFAGPLEAVGETRLFARRVSADRQALVYSMRFAAAAAVAMILPIPVVAGCADDAVSFVDLSGYAGFFDDIEALFPPPQVSRGMQQARFHAPAVLKVVEVGAFDASFVPTLRDFDRVDRRFRLDDAVWRALPRYADFGFVVFKLRAGEGAMQRAHPMAFTFPTRFAERLFFPTVHVHDGQVHAFADFDHVLYGQTAATAGLEEVSTEAEAPPGLWARLTGRRGVPVRVSRAWGASLGAAARVVDLERAQGLVAGAAPVYRVELSGSLRNEDVIIR